MFIRKLPEEECNHDPLVVIYIRYFLCANNMMIRFHISDYLGAYVNGILSFIKDEEDCYQISGYLIDALFSFQMYVGVCCRGCRTNPGTGFENWTTECNNPLQCCCLSQFAWLCFE